MDSKEQFDRQAKYYSSSKTFSAGESLKILSDLISKKKYNYGLDIGTGAGFAAFELTKYCKNVVATDISQGMIDEAIKIMNERKIKNLSFNISKAEELKFEDGTFDIVTCRTAAHHFIDVKKFCHESNRVLSREGNAIIVDTITSDQKKLNEWHQEVESIRDKSHIRNLSLLEWKEIFKISKFEIIDIAQSRVHMNLGDWMERSGTSEKDKKNIQNKFLSAEKKIKEFFGIMPQSENNISFYWPVGIFHLRKLN
tara:strand:+ start:52 stop:813 length:762 start_codon:yes stop_codon:yes gene_type:complete